MSVPLSHCKAGLSPFKTDSKIQLTVIPAETLDYFNVWRREYCHREVDRKQEAERCEFIEEQVSLTENAAYTHTLQVMIFNKVLNKRSQELVQTF